MKNTILKVVKQKEYDRYVFLTYNNDEIVGLNFWQGLYEGSYDIVMNDKGYEPCIHLTDIYNRLKITYETISDEERINKAIHLYTDAFIIQERNKNSIPLLAAQKDIIAKALKYYLDQYDYFVPYPNHTESWGMHDIKTLIAFMNYDIQIELTDTDIKYFTAKHGIDMPIYN